MNKPTSQDYVYFNVFSYKGDQYAENYADIVNKSNEKLINYSNKDYDTCYALPIDKIIVTLNDESNETYKCYEKYSNTNIIWDFGDGTKSTELSAVHWYKYPGKYNITLTVFDKNLTPHQSLYNTDITVWNYIPRELEINSDGEYDYTYGDVLRIIPYNLININYAGNEQLIPISNDDVYTRIIPSAGVLIYNEETKNTPLTLNSVFSSYIVDQFNTDEPIESLYTPKGNTLFYLNTPYLEFNIYRFNSWQSYNVLSSTGYNVELYTENSKAPFVSREEYMSDAYSHLLPTSRFIDDNDSVINDIYFESAGTEVYVKYDLDLAKFVICEKDDDGSVLIGTYDKKHLRFTDDYPLVVGKTDDLGNIKHNLSIGAIFNTTGFKLEENTSSGLKQQWYNAVPSTFNFKNLLSAITLKGTSTLSTSAFYSTTFNTCGLNGEKYDIYNYKFISIPINFVISINVNTEQGLHPYKVLTNFDITSDGTITDLTNPDKVCGKINVLQITESKSIPIERTALYGYVDENNNILSAYNYTFSAVNIEGLTGGGYLKGQIIFNTDESKTKEYKNICLQLVLTGIVPDIGYYNNIMMGIKSVPYQYVGDFTTDAFNVVNIHDNQLRIFKRNETFDLSNNYKTIAQQPILRDSESLFNNILGQIVGTNEDYNNLGVQIYEKISNYVANTQDIDTCNIAHLYDAYNKYDEHIADLNYDWPAELQRNIDLMSIKFNKLYGSYNQFDSDFDKHGYVSNPNYGKNLGDEIDFDTGKIRTDETIIAYEKFSGKYIKLNCNIDKKYIENAKYEAVEVANGIYEFPLALYMDQYGIVQGIKSIELKADKSTITPIESANFTATINYNYTEDNRFEDIWGWNLVLPKLEDRPSTFDITDYYTFYRFKPSTYNTTPIESIIDWNNPYNNMISPSSFNATATSQPLTLWNNMKKYYIIQTVAKNII